ncbi:hypothetical protein Scep_007494 [Stephania cephalantha]|uniref:Uncharacterized protein n=1 Tax=Stephania cephalantha TaxID=152367 RepID=A0AAP0KA70_9MAGN
MTALLSLIREYKGLSWGVNLRRIAMAVCPRKTKAGEGRTYVLGWTPSGSKRRHAGVGFSRPIFVIDEPIELLRKDIKEMQTNLLRVIQDNTLDRDQLRELQGRLGCMEQALKEKLRISFSPPPGDVPDDSNLNDNPDD